MNRIMTVLICAAGFSLLSSCAGSGAAKGGAVWSDVQGKEWMLSAFTGASGAVAIDRTKNAGMGEFYSLKFEADRISGTGAPNRYSGPYTAGEANALSIGMLVSTRMASLFEPEGLKENEYFAFLGRVKRWNLTGGKLELYSLDENGGETVLAYDLK